MKFQFCVCGSADSSLWATVSDIDIVSCTECGVRRVLNVDAGAYSKLYTSGKYHSAGSVDTVEETAKRGVHSERMSHDLDVAAQRLEKLKKYCHSGVLLDVGCANGAFMLAAKDSFEVHGIDLSSEAAHPDIKQKVRVGEMNRVGFQRRTFDVITFNDSFEHFLNPLDGLKAASGLLKRGGILAIEVPDMGCVRAFAEREKFVHVKPHEHLWYFAAAQLRNLLESNGYAVLGIDVPIEGKVAIYASPHVFVEEVEIHGPAGIGDIIWTLSKLKGIREREFPCKIKYVVCCDAEVKVVTRGKDFLLLSEYIDSVEFRALSLPPDKGCSDPCVPIYQFLANDYLDPKAPPWKGNAIQDWHPELSTSFDIGIRVPHRALDQVNQRMRKQPYIAVYMSSHIWNKCTLHPYWSVQDWAKLLIGIHEAGFKAVVLGAGWDSDFMRDVCASILEQGYKLAQVVVNMVGRTPIPLALAYMRLASATIGIAAGLPIIGAYFGYKTAIMWPVRGVSEVDVTKVVNGDYCSFCPEFPTNWMPPEVLRSCSYEVLRVGEFDAGSALRSILDLARK